MKLTCFVHSLVQIIRLYLFDWNWTKHVTQKKICSGVTTVGCKESEHLSHAAQTQANNRNIQITLSPFSPGSPGFPGTPCNKHQHIRVKEFTSCKALLWWSCEMIPWCERSHSLYYIILWSNQGQLNQLLRLPSVRWVQENPTLQQVPYHPKSRTQEA